MNNEGSTENKKNQLLHGGLWVVAIVFIAFAAYLLVNFFNNKIASPVPNNYKFMVVDHYTKSGKDWATYYVYSDYVLVQKDDANGEPTSDPIMAYDNVNTSDLVLDESDTTRICDSDACYSYPKALVAVKKLIANKYWREYTGR